MWLFWLLLGGLQFSLCHSGKLHKLVIEPTKCTSFSQHNEEMTVVEMFFKGKKQGTFVEIGAFDGLNFSNTYYLESCLDWKGRLIEGNSANYRKLQQNLKYRPNVDTVHSAVCVPPATAVNFTIEATTTSGSVEGMSESFKGKWHPRGLRLQEVPCGPMSDLLRGLAHVDFWSLDVEGSELLAISTVDFVAVQIDVIIIELDGHDPPKNYQIRSILNNAGYTECRWGSRKAPANGLFIRRASPYKCNPRLGTQHICANTDCWQRPAA